MKYIDNISTNTPNQEASSGSHLSSSITGRRNLELGHYRGDWSYSSEDCDEFGWFMVDVSTPEARRAVRHHLLKTLLMLDEMEEE